MQMKILLNIVMIITMMTIEGDSNSTLNSNHVPGPLHKLSH
jgi:hypothetical protein